MFYRIRFYREKTTQVSPTVILDRIQSILEEKNYVPGETKNNKVLLREDYFQIRWSWSWISRVDRGEFEIVPLGGGESIVKFAFYISYLFELIVVTFATIIGLTTEAGFGVFIWIVLLLFHLLAHVCCSIIACEEMLEKIAEPAFQEVT